jgi:uncharacterized phiE125 gp8 family phage protein
MTGFGQSWDTGITWFTRRTVEPADFPINVVYLREKVLRTANGEIEDDYLENCLMAATQAAETDTRRALVPQTWELILSGFPSGGIEIPRPPFIAIAGFPYHDSDDEQQRISVSPADYRVAPSGRFSKAVLLPLSGASWPGSTSVREDAVTITYTAGYTDENDGEYQVIKAGIGLMVGELYKQRSLSVQQPNNTAARLDLTRFWRPVV